MQSVSPSPEAGSPEKSWSQMIPLLLVVLGALLLMISARGDLWFDEVLSFQWARSAKSPMDLLELFRHDNNHPLNSLWILLVGDGHSPFAYRALSIFSGILSLVLIHGIARKISPAAGWVPLALAAFSFPLVLYASEARGYAPAVACSLAAFYVLLKTDRQPGWISVPVFWILCAAGMLAHGTMLYILGALGVWALVCGLTTTSPVKALLNVAIWFAIPAILSIGYYLYFLRLMMVAGGPEYSISTVLGHFFGYALGFPTEGAGAFFTLAISAAFLIAAMGWGKMEGQHLRLLFILVLVVFPAFALLVVGAKFLYFRYFLVCLPFLYLLGGPLAARILISRSRAWRIGGCIFLGIVIAGQVPRLIPLIQFGRGSYHAALRSVAGSPVANKTISSDQDMRNGIVVEYYRKSVPFFSDLRYIPQWEKRVAPATWLITHSQEAFPLKPVESLSIFGGTYRLQGIFPSGPVSGTHWFLYLLKPGVQAKLPSTTQP